MLEGMGVPKIHYQWRALMELDKATSLGLTLLKKHNLNKWTVGWYKHPGLQAGGSDRIIKKNYA